MLNLGGRLTTRGQVPFASAHLASLHLNPSDIMLGKKSQDPWVAKPIIVRIS